MYHIGHYICFFTDYLTTDITRNMFLLRKCGKDIQTLYISMKTDKNKVKKGMNIYTLVIKLMLWKNREQKFVVELQKKFTEQKV